LPIFFTPTQAYEHLPEVRRIVERVMGVRKEADNSTDSDAVNSAMRVLENEMRKLEEIGCVLKDIRTGLVDFPAVRLGTRVWLCWKLGEDNVSFWHGLQEGFAGRKMVVEDEFYEDDLALKSIAEVAKA